MLALYAFNLEIAYIGTAINIIKTFWFTTGDTPDNQGIKVLQEESGFYYLNALVQDEGYQTPFASIEEIGVYLEKEITLIKEDDLIP